MMKVWLLLSVFLLAGNGSKKADESVSMDTQKKVRTQCVFKQELTKEQSKVYKGTGICVARVDGMGFSCVKKRIFQKGNCVADRIDASNEKP